MARSDLTQIVKAISGCLSVVNVRVCTRCVQSIAKTSIVKVRKAEMMRAVRGVDYEGTQCVGDEGKRLTELMRRTERGVDEEDRTLC